MEKGFIENSNAYQGSALRLQQENMWNEKEIPRDSNQFNYNHVNKPIIEESADRRKYNKGRPRKLGARKIRHLKIKLSNLQKIDNPNFIAVKLQKVCGLDSKFSTTTIHKALYSMNYFSLNTRQKGVMTGKDKKICAKFCKKCLKLVGWELWLQMISFYYDGVTFYHKSDPFSRSIQSKAKIWRKRSKGLRLTQKGKKTGNNGRQVTLLVDIAYMERGS